MENGNLPAFGYGFANEQAHQEVAGLSKREYFSAMAMQGLLSKGNDLTYSPKDIANYAVDYADYLLTQLEITK